MPTPRLLTDAQAAEYLGGIPVAEVVREGVGRVKFGRSVRYDIRALDAHLDALSKLAPDSPAANDDGSATNEADAALDRFIPAR